MTASVDELIASSPEWFLADAQDRMARELSARERELFEDAPFTRPVDFHSWRRAYSQALANAGASAQQAQALAGHSSLDAHARYLHNTAKMTEVPAAALPSIRGPAPTRGQNSSFEGEVHKSENPGLIGVLSQLRGGATRLSCPAVSRCCGGVGAVRGGDRDWVAVAGAQKAINGSTAT